MCCSLHEIAQVVTQSPGLVPEPAWTARQMPDVFVVGQERQAQFQGIAYIIYHRITASIKYS